MRVQGSGFRVQGSGFRVQGSGFRVQGLGEDERVSGCSEDARAGRFHMRTLIIYKLGFNQNY